MRSFGLLLLAIIAECFAHSYVQSARLSLCAPGLRLVGCNEGSRTSRAEFRKAPACSLAAFIHVCSRPRLGSIVLSAASVTSMATLAELADQYDAFLLDQFGVIHDGKNAYEGAVEAVQALQRKGKKIVIISNSSRRQGDTTERLRRMGFGPFTDEEDASPHELTPICVITSGDLVWQGLNGQITQNMQTCADGGEDAADLFSDLGKRCFVFGNGEDDAEYVSTCGREIFPIKQADFVMARGLFAMLGDPDGPTQYSIERETQVLEAALRRRPGGLPLLVSNPDELRPDGKDSPMPGQLARRYRGMGARDVRLVGKPHRLIYGACRERLSYCGVASSARVVGVGDSLPHDILGASSANLDSIFICSGVHYRELGVPQAGTEVPDAAKLGALLNDFTHENRGCQPTHILAAFRM